MPHITVVIKKGALLVRHIALLLTVLAFPLNANCQDALPPIVNGGFDLLISDGPDAAIDHWAASWTSDDDLLRKAQLKSAFRPLQESLGEPDGYEIIEADWIGARVVEVFAVVFHPKQPLFFYLRAYDSTTGWLISNVNANTSMSEVFPEWVMRGRSR